MSNCRKNNTDSNNTQNDDGYGFFCDLEANHEEVEYYVVTKVTHYEVRRKLPNRPKINGGFKTHIINLSFAKSSVDDFVAEQNTKNKENKGKSNDICKYIMSFFVCLTAGSCLYFATNAQI
jgi:hypothetical protein